MEHNNNILFYLEIAIRCAVHRFQTAIKNGMLPETTNLITKGRKAVVILRNQNMVNVLNNLKLPIPPKDTNVR